MASRDLADPRAVPSAADADDLTATAIRTIRGLCIDAVEAAGSGHPGLPLAMAPAAYLLYARIMAHDPADPGWPDRDRFVLSAGHGSALLYSVLHLAGYDLPLEELRRFRQWGSATPGHPERGPETPGVETTTGPLGQGFANGVGMAMAERFLRERYGAELMDHRIYGICSDGDLMEGVGSEAASLAGHLGLGAPRLHLRRQPDHDRRPDRSLLLQRGRRGAIPRLRLADALGRGRQRPRGSRRRCGRPARRRSARRWSGCAR